VFASIGLRAIRTPVCECTRRAIRGHHPARVPRPDTHSRAASPQSRARRERRALQLTPASPDPQPSEHRPTPKRPRLRSATPAARTCDEPTSWAASSMSTAWLHDRGGWIVGTHRRGLT
jgi:hypothetical protein